MTFPEEFKIMRQRCLLSQATFAKEVGVSFSTLNRWEGGKAKSDCHEEYQGIL